MLEEKNAGLLDSLVTLTIPKFGGTHKKINISPKQIAKELDFVIRLSDSGKYELYDNNQKYLVLKNSTINAITDELLDSYKSYKMGILKRHFKSIDESDN